MTEDSQIQTGGCPPDQAAAPSLAQRLRRMWRGEDGAISVEMIALAIAAVALAAAVIPLISAALTRMGLRIFQ